MRPDLSPWCGCSAIGERSRCSQTSPNRRVDGTPAPRENAAPAAGLQRSYPPTTEAILLSPMLTIRLSKVGTVVVIWLLAAVIHALLGSSPDLCVKAEEAPRLRLGCLGDLLFLEE